MCRVPAQPSAEIAHVECAKCRRECDLAGARATLCGDRACRVREMQARGVEYLGSWEMSVVRGVAGELEAENWRRGRTTVVRGVAGEWEDENWRVGSTTGVRGVSGELEAENWRVSSTTLVRGVICGAGS